MTVTLMPDSVVVSDDDFYYEREKPHGLTHLEGIAVYDPNTDEAIEVDTNIGRFRISWKDKGAKKHVFNTERLPRMVNTVKTQTTFGRAGTRIVLETDDLVFSIINRAGARYARVEDMRNKPSSCEYHILNDGTYSIAYSSISSKSSRYWQIKYLLEHHKNLFFI